MDGPGALATARIVHLIFRDLALRGLLPHRRELADARSHGRPAPLVKALKLHHVIACLGLFGLAAFTTAQRIKEIGIRKVIGATIISILALLSKDFLKLVFIAVCIASPVAWFIVNKWLQNFAYHIQISWFTFIVVGLCAMLIALITISFQSVKAAIANPVKSLRME